MTATPTLKRVRVYRTLADGTDAAVLGTIVNTPRGWVFLPNVNGRKPSRRGWASWEASLPRWVGYPDSCRTEEA